jgi:hypothetical protein
MRRRDSFGLLGAMSSSSSVAWPYVRPAQMSERTLVGADLHPRSNLVVARHDEKSIQIPTCSPRSTSFVVASLDRFGAQSAPPVGDARRTGRPGRPVRLRERSVRFARAGWSTATQLLVVGDPVRAGTDAGTQQIGAAGQGPGRLVARRAAPVSGSGSNGSAATYVSPSMTTKPPYCAASSN